MESLRIIDTWPVPTAAAAVVRADGTVLGTHGLTAHRFPLASVTKPLAAYAALVAYEEGAIELDEPAGPEGSTVRHLLAHTSGLAFDEHRVTAPPGNRRLYSNAGFEVLGDHIAKASGIPFAEYLRQAVLEPLNMASTSLDGSPARDGVSTVDDLVRFAAEVQAPASSTPVRSSKPRASSTRASRASCRATATRARTTGASASRSATPSPRTGRALPPPRRPSATSASRARSSGSTRWPGSPAWR